MQAFSSNAQARVRMRRWARAMRVQAKEMAPKLTPVTQKTAGKDDEDIGDQHDNEVATAIAHTES